MAKVKLHHNWAFYHTRRAHLNRIVEDQRVGLGSDMAITQHHLNVLFRDIVSNKDYTDVYSS